MQAIFKQLKKQGWSVELRKCNHWRLTAPDGRVTYTGGSPSDWRSVRNLRAKLRRMGCELP